MHDVHKGREEHADYDSNALDDVCQAGDVVNVILDVAQHTTDNIAKHIDRRRNTIN